MSLDQLHRRSVGFIDHEHQSWACFLVTFQGGDRRWHGYLSFRPGDGETVEDEVRTTDIFLEDTESEIHGRARGFAKPVLEGLLASALHTQYKNGNGPLRLRRWFRSLLAESSSKLAGGWADDGEADAAPLDPVRLKALYASYRLDQVAHFIALLRPDAFEATVGHILEGKVVDPTAADRLDHAWTVVQYIDRHLPLPPFDRWATDFTTHRSTYRLYAQTLHLEGRLP